MDTPKTPESSKRTLAVWKFASCDGCQLSLLDCERELLALSQAVEIASFPEASSARVAGPYDISLVEGSIATERDRKRIHEVRASSRRLVTIGACASSGGIQALRNFARLDDYLRVVYARPEYIDSLSTSTPVAEHVAVDVELRGCPVDKRQLLSVLTALLQDRRPELPRHSVCVDCKLAGEVCVMVARGESCLGPVTQSGCGALCPRFHRGCFGCFGPADVSQSLALSETLRERGTTTDGVSRLFSTFAANAPAFRAAARDAQGGENG